MKALRLGILAAVVASGSAIPAAADINATVVYRSGERASRETAHRFYEALGLEQISRRYLREL